MYENKQTLANTKGAIKNGHFRKTGNIGYKRRRITKQYVLDTTIHKQRK